MGKGDIPFKCKKNYASTRERLEILGRNLGQRRSILTISLISFREKVKDVIFCLKIDRKVKNKRKPMSLVDTANATTMLNHKGKGDNFRVYAKVRHFFTGTRVEGEMTDEDGKTQIPTFTKSGETHLAIEKRNIAQKSNVRSYFDISTIG
jgi:hypothetical protein